MEWYRTCRTSAEGIKEPAKNAQYNMKAGGVKRGGYAAENEGAQQVLPQTVKAGSRNARARGCGGVAARLRQRR